jgi:uncharacterized protein YpuA (DUF1002 family)
MTQATDTDIREVRDLLLGMDKKLDVFMARTDERFNSIDQRFQAVDQRFIDLGKRMDSLEQSVNKRIDSLEQRNVAQDVRFWGFLGIIVTALIGLLSKLAFFPGGVA